MLVFNAQQLDSDGSALVFAMPSSRVRDSRHHWEGPFDGQLGFRSVAATGYRPQKQSDPVMGSRLTRLRRPNMQNVCLDQILLTQTQSEYAQFLAPRLSKLVILFPKNVSLSIHHATSMAVWCGLPHCHIASVDFGPEPGSRGSKVQLLDGGIGRMHSMPVVTWCLAMLWGQSGRRSHPERRECSWSCQ